MCSLGREDTAEASAHLPRHPCTPPYNSTACKHTRVQPFPLAMHGTEARCPAGGREVRPGPSQGPTILQWTGSPQGYSYLCLKTQEQPGWQEALPCRIIPLNTLRHCQTSTGTAATMPNSRMSRVHAPNPSPPQVHTQAHPEAEGGSSHWAVVERGRQVDLGCQRVSSRPLRAFPEEG